MTTQTPHLKAKAATPLVAVLFGAACLGGQALASETVAPGLTQDAQPATFEFMVVNQRVPDFLTLFARHAGVRIDVTEHVRGDLRGRHIAGTPQDILTALARQFDLDWFEFNGVHYLSARTESATRMIRLGSLRADTARQALTDAGLNSARFPVRDAAGGTAIVLSGPPKLLGITEAVIENVPDLQARIRVRRAGVLSTEPGAFPIATPPPEPEPEPAQSDEVTPSPEGDSK